jgi:hypothetical protein
MKGCGRIFIIVLPIKPSMPSTPCPIAVENPGIDVNWSTCSGLISGLRSATSRDICSSFISLFQLFQLCVSHHVLLLVLLLLPPYTL